MSALEQLVARMPLLAEGEHPLGLKAKRAAEFSARVQATGDVAAALRDAEADPLVGEVLAQAKPPDAVAVVLRLLAPVGEVATLRRMLRSAAGYPVALIVSFAVAAWAVFALSIPALTTLGADRTELRVTELAVVVACLAMLGAVAWVTARGHRIPGFRAGHRALDRALALEVAAALVEHQVQLAQALMAGSVAASGAMRLGAQDLARAFVAGSRAPESPLLDGEAAGILMASAARGVAGPVLRALADQALLDARLRLPADVRRVQGFSLVCAGVALLALAAGWYQTYLHAVID